MGDACETTILTDQRVVTIKCAMLLAPPPPNSNLEIQPFENLLLVSSFKNIFIFCIMLPFLKSFLPHPILTPNKTELKIKRLQIPTKVCVLLVVMVYLRDR